MNLHALIAQGEHQQQDFKYKIEDAAKLARSVSAFANTDGGRLLIGVRDDGRITGVAGEEEIFMMQTAASRYCLPAVKVDFETVHAEGRTVVICTVPKSQQRPIAALDDIVIDPQTGVVQPVGRPTAYIRIDDENIVASPVLLAIWRAEGSPLGQVVSFSQTEQQVLQILSLQPWLTLNQLVRQAHAPRRKVVAALANFIRYGLVEWAFRERQFCFSQL